MRKRYQLYGKNRQVFLDGLQRYRDQGVPILLDGKETEARDWIRILEEQPDGSFYMGDYVMEDVVKGENLQPGDMVYEDSGVYGAEDNAKKALPEKQCVRVLKEIRFDRVYNR